jgi:TonB family protein
MSIRSVVPVALMLLAAALPSPSPAAAQDAGSRQERALARRWATIRADSAAVDGLFQATVRVGGPVLFDAVLRAARDPGRAQLVRVHALAALYAYAVPGHADGAHTFLWAARDAAIGCQASLAWAQGDTLRACVRSFPLSEPPVGRRAPPDALTADSARVNAIVAAARAIARGGRSPLAGAADLLLWRLNDSRPRYLRTVAACPRNARPPLPPGDTAALDRERVYPVAEVTQAPTLANACYVARQLTRNYPPLARDAGEEGTVVLSLVLEPTGDVREATVERAAGRPEFGAAAVRVTAWMQFTPARLGTARVPVRISVPVRFGFGGEYPRVADP